MLNSATEPEVKLACELHIKKLCKDLEKLNRDNVFNFAGPLNNSPSQQSYKSTTTGSELMSHGQTEKPSLTQISAIQQTLEDIQLMIMEIIVAAELLKATSNREIIIMALATQMKAKQIVSSEEIRRKSLR